MIRLKTYPVDDILPLITEGGSVLLDDETVKVGTLRMMTFKVKGLVCVGCGITGTVFAMEKDSKSPVFHLNLYHVGGDGREILMTHDHILARADGGKEHISNSQTMCAPCNVKKGSKVQPGGCGVSKSSFKSLAELLPSSARRNLEVLFSGIGDDDKLKKLLMDYLLSLRKTCCPSLPTHALPSVPEEISIEKFDMHHKIFIPVGEKVVIVPTEGGFYIFNKRTRERLQIYLKGGT
jgi:hypothetical protein